MLVIVISIVINMNKKLNKKIKMEQQKIEFYKEKIKKIKKIKTKEDALIKLNDLAREFFKERFSIPYNKTYLTISDQFIKEKKLKQASFCISMNEMMYSKQKISDSSVNEAIKIFSDLVDEVDIFKN